MFPILARTRWFFIYSYTAVLTLGLLLSIGILYWKAQKSEQPIWLDGILFGLFGGIATGRIVFVAIEWGYYAERGDELGKIWQGGLNFHGVLLGAMLGIGIGAFIQKRPFFPSLNEFAPVIPLLFLAGWGACWLEGCAYGVETTLGFFSSNLPDHLGVFSVRYQTQLAGMIISSLLLLWGLFERNGRNLPFLLGISLFTHAMITQFRGDSAILINNIRLDIIIDIVLVLFCLILIQYSPVSDNKR